MTLVSANLSWLVGIEACWGDARDVAGGNGLRGGDELGKASTMLKTLCYSGSSVRSDSVGILS